MEVRTAVVKCLRETAEEQAQHGLPSDITDDTDLAHFTSDSVGFAVLLARLEAAFGCYPFADEDTVSYPKTVGELVAIYEDLRNHR